MHEDDPTDVVHDDFAEAMFGDTPLGRPILGTIDTIQGISRRAINSFYRSKYRPGSIVVAAAGNVEHDAVVRRVKAAFAPVLAVAVDESTPEPGHDLEDAYVRSSDVVATYRQPRQLTIRPQIYWSARLADRDALVVDAQVLVQTSLLEIGRVHV